MPNYKLTTDEAKEICKLGQGRACCAYLILGKNFECARSDVQIEPIITKRLKQGTMNARGKGGWKGCKWEGQI